MEMEEATTPAAVTTPGRGAGVLDGPRKITRAEDIPDSDFKEPEKVVLPADVAQEREVRRYIRKDGVFIKDLPGLWELPTGERDVRGKVKTGPDNLPKRQRQFTLEEVNEFVIKECEKSGRTMSVDGLSGRPKATPGWDLTIHVPGQSQSEQQAAMPPTGEEAIKNTQALVTRLSDENAKLKLGYDDLAEELRDIKALLAQGPADSVKPLEKMNHEELDNQAAGVKIVFPKNNDEGKPVTKSDKIAAIRKAWQEANA